MTKRLSATIILLMLFASLLPSHLFVFGGGWSGTGPSLVVDDAINRINATIGVKSGSVVTAKGTVTNVGPSALSGLLTAIFIREDAHGLIPSDITGEWSSDGITYSPMAAAAAPASAAWDIELTLGPPGGYPLTVGENSTTYVRLTAHNDVGPSSDTERQQNVAVFVYKDNDLSYTWSTGDTMLSQGPDDYPVNIDLSVEHTAEIEGTGQFYYNIQDAIDGAAPGKTILVYDGTYLEALHIIKAVTIKPASKPVIKGSQLFATDYGSREAVIFVEDASGVFLENLDIQGQNLGPARNYGVLYQNASGAILDCTVSPNTIGDLGSVGIAGISRSDLLIEQCVIENFGRIGIYATNVENVAIYDNEIIGQIYSGEGEVNYGIEIEDYDGPSNAQIHRNEIYNSDNTYSPEPLWSSAAIIADIWRMYYDLSPSTVSIKYNDIHDNYLAIEVVSNPSMHAHYNNIYNNRYGVAVDPDLTDSYEAFDARSNWWGHASGPDHPTSWNYTVVPGENITVGPNPGSGESATDYVVYEPWLEEAWPPVLPTLSIDPSSYQATSYHETFDLDLQVSNLEENWRVVGIQFRLKFNFSLLEVLDVTEGPLIDQVGDVFVVWAVDYGDLIWGDNLIVGVALLPQNQTTGGAWWSQFPDGSGTVATITFRAIYQDIGLENPPVGCDLVLADSKIIDDTTQEISHDTADGYYEILPWPRPELVVDIASDTYTAKQLNETFTLDVIVTNLHASLMQPIAAQFRLLFNGTLLEVVSVTEGPFMQQFGDTFSIHYTTYEDIVWGSNVVVGVIILPDETGNWAAFANGTGTLASITFKTVYQHVGLEKPPLSCNLTLVETQILDFDLEEIDHIIANWGYYEILPNNIADINWDYVVDIKDVAIAAHAFGSFPGHPRWNPIADVTGDEKVDIRDIAIVASQFGWVDP